MKEDIQATLVPVGITGLLQIEIIGGTNQAQLLEPGTFIPPGASKFENITGKAEVIAEKLEILLNNFAQLTDETNRKKIENILTNVDVIIEDNKDPINNIVVKLDETSSRAASTRRVLISFASERISCSACCRCD